MADMESKHISWFLKANHVWSGTALVLGRLCILIESIQILNTVDVAGVAYATDQTLIPWLELYCSLKEIEVVKWNITNRNC